MIDSLAEASLNGSDHRNPGNGQAPHSVFKHGCRAHWRKQQNTARTDRHELINFPALKPGNIQPERMHIPLHDFFQRPGGNRIHETGIPFTDRLVLIRKTKQDDRPVHQQRTAARRLCGDMHTPSALFDHAACGEHRQSRTDRSARNSELLRQQSFRRNFRIRRKTPLPDQLHHIPDHLLSW